MFLWLRSVPPQKSQTSNKGRRKALSFVPSRSSQRKEFQFSQRSVIVAEASLDWLRFFFSFQHTLSAFRKLSWHMALRYDITQCCSVKICRETKKHEMQTLFDSHKPLSQFCSVTTTSKLSLTVILARREDHYQRVKYKEHNVCVEIPVCILATPVGLALIQCDRGNFISTRKAELRREGWGEEGWLIAPDTLDAHIFRFGLMLAQGDHHLRFSQQKLPWNS